LPQFPDLPTVAETIPGFAATGWQVLLAPNGTPQAIVDKVSADLLKVTKDPGFETKLGNVGSYPQPLTEQEALEFVDQEQKTWLPLLERIAKK